MQVFWFACHLQELQAMEKKWAECEKKREKRRRDEYFSDH